MESWRIFAMWDAAAGPVTHRSAKHRGSRHVHFASLQHNRLIKGLMTVAVALTNKDS